MQQTECPQVPLRSQVKVTSLHGSHLGLNTTAVPHIQLKLHLCVLQLGKQLGAVEKVNTKHGRAC